MTGPVITTSDQSADSGAPVVVLLGPPGCGASEVAPLLADALGVEARDSDAEVERRTGRPAGDVLVDDGEDAFRAVEREAVAAVLRPGPAVVALGSGAVLDAGTRAALAELRAGGAVVVLLDVSPEEAARRAGLNQPRPLLLGNPRAQLRALLDARRPLYGQVATLVVETDGLTAQDLAAGLAATLTAAPGGAPAPAADGGAR